MRIPGSEDPELRPESAEVTRRLANVKCTRQRIDTGATTIANDVMAPIAVASGDSSSTSSTSASHHSGSRAEPFDLDSRHRTGTERLLEPSRVVDARFAGRERPVQHRRLSEARACAQKNDGVSLKVLGTRSGEY